MAERRYVVPGSDGGWNVTKPGTSRRSAYADTPGQAINRARYTVTSAGGGAVNMGTMGRFGIQIAVGAGGDPHPHHDAREGAPRSYSYLSPSK